MPFVQNNEIAQVNVVGVLFGQQTVNTFFYRWNAEDGLAAMNQLTLLELVTAALSSPYQAAVSEDWKGLRTEVKDPRTVPVFASADQSITGWEGNGPSPATAPATTAVITRRTLMAGRSFRGRIYVPAVPDEWITEGRLNDSGILAYTTLRNACVDDITTTDPNGYLDPVVWSRELQTGESITSAITRTVMRQQRRREVGVGV